MARRVRSAALRYALALGLYGLLILLSFGIQRLFGISPLKLREWRNW